ncbi:hypothetical protein [Saccharothrix variisporea]|uniref:Uncharacterized protein n=1 Tax=Saccharothrix variisporea TaxID=543527 RepID=A0A495WZ02_9PSEU|nr:hypothetical protein [Saccharothrix variisporea]RKT67081.1 hypothetical protein DFJ66_0249 [Saccharothrix variisporea]
MTDTAQCGRSAPEAATERAFECLPRCIEHDGSTRHPDENCWSEQPAGRVPTTLANEPVVLRAVGRQINPGGERLAEVVMFVGVPGDDESELHAEMTGKQARELAARLVEAAQLAEGMVWPCPLWCSEPPGHPFIPRGADSLPVRVHQADPLGDGCLVVQAREWIGEDGKALLGKERTFFRGREVSAADLARMVSTLKATLVELDEVGAETWLARQQGGVR